MLRKKSIRNNRFPYHVMTRTSNADWFSIPMDIVWEIVLQALKISMKKHPFKLMSFVLMSNHYHMVLKTPDANLDQIMFEFNRNLLEGLRSEASKENQVFDGRYKWRIVTCPKYLRNVIKYVYQNPVRAGIVKLCETYPYSTLRYLLKSESFVVPIFIEYDYFVHDLKFIKWINSGLDYESVRKRLDRSTVTYLGASQPAYSTTNLIRP